MQTKNLSIHRPSKRPLLTENTLGHYLAGLIDGDGHFSTMGHIVISFNLRDKRDAYSIRSLLGYGKVRPVKDKNAVNLIISNKTGVKHVAALVRDKLKHPVRISQYNTRIYELGFSSRKTSRNTTIDWETSWFAGFCDADGHLRIDTPWVEHRNSYEVQLLCQIDQEDDILLKQMKDKFGGYLSHKTSPNTYSYSSVSFKGIHLVLRYFDRYSLQLTQSYLRYTILRKSYLIVQKKQHLTVKGLDTIFTYKDKLKEMI
jgi:hypothetical protein